jgi:hypothetical protein
MLSQAEEASSQYVSQPVTLLENSFNQHAQGICRQLSSQP